MKIATINIPDDFLADIETLVNLGFYPSRSECVREALKQFLDLEIKMTRDLSPANFEELKNRQMETMLH